MNALIHTAPAVQVRDRLARPLHDLRLSVIEACNFRCDYCMPADAVPDDYGFDQSTRLSFDEIDTLVRAFVQLGVNKLRITGGEPLLRKRLPELIARLAAISRIDDIAMTTNASLLAPHAQALFDAGLKRITVSLDAMDADVFHQLSGKRGQLSDVLKGLDAARRAGFNNIKLNSVIRHGQNESQIIPLAAFAREHGHTLRFIEYMDVGTCNHWSQQQVVTSDNIRAQLHAHWPLHALTANYTGEVAQRYAYADGQGEIGLISSVSHPFCGDCHRARVSADGQLYTCLFASQGTSLRQYIAQGEMALAEALKGYWQARQDRYSELRAESQRTSRKRVEMFLIGG